MSRRKPGSKIKPNKRKGILQRRRSLVEVEDLIEQGEYKQAADILDGMLMKQPHDPALLDLRLAVAKAMGDIHASRRGYRRLLELRPQDAELLLKLAAAYEATGMQALALTTYRGFLSLARKHPEANLVRLHAEELDSTFREVMVKEQMFQGTSDPLTLCVLHEEVLLSLEDSQFAQAKASALRLIEQAPDFVAARNNLVEAQLRLGELDEALAGARASVERWPGNLFARANLVRGLFLLGRFDEARSMAEPLNDLSPQRDEDWLKLMETWTLLAEHQRVLEIWELSRHAMKNTPAAMKHFAGVAAARLGREAEARQWFREVAFHLVIASENLVELSKPEGNRHGAWPFDTRYWLPEHVVVAASDKQRAPAFFRHFVEADPRFIALTPVLLERGDAATRLFVGILSENTPPGPLHDAIKAYVFDERGTYASRADAATMLSKKGLLPSGPLTLIDKGQPRELMLISWEVHEETSLELPEAPQTLHDQAFEALENGDGAKAEHLLRQAIPLAPDSPSVLNNLIASLEIQGRKAEAASLVDDLVRRFPDYFFGKILLAKRAIANGQADQARQILLPLLSEKRFHVTEFRALATTQVDVLIALGRPHEARHWLNLWRQFEPDHPGAPHYANKVNSHGLIQTLESLVGM